MAKAQFCQRRVPTSKIQITWTTTGGVFQILRAVSPEGMRLTLRAILNGISLKIRVLPVSIKSSVILEYVERVLV